jgi:hypothetical protein
MTCSVRRTSSHGILLYSGSSTTTAYIEMENENEENKLDRICYRFPNGIFLRIFHRMRMHHGIQPALYLARMGTYNHFLVNVDPSTISDGMLFQKSLYNYHWKTDT